MSSRITIGVKDGRKVTLDDVVAGEKGITCWTCQGTLCCKDGKGKHRLTENHSRRSIPKGKHFAHTQKSKCYGEGPAHYQLKQNIARAFNRMVETCRRNPDNTIRSLGINYPCPSPAYGVHCGDWASVPFRFERSMLGNHWFDLQRGLHEVKTEHTLGAGVTRPDVVGLDKAGNPLWIIEIYRTHRTSESCLTYAAQNGIPVFQVNIDDIPANSQFDGPLAELEDERFWLREDNAKRGYLFADKSWNTVCEREAIGMPVDAHRWGKLNARFPDGTEKLLHQCGEAVCPDVSYIWANGLTYDEMYLESEHLTQSHTYQN